MLYGTRGEFRIFARCEMIIVLSMSNNAPILYLYNTRIQTVRYRNVIITYTISVLCRLKFVFNFT